MLRGTETVRRQSLATALVAGILGRSLDPTEDALLGWAVGFATADAFVAAYDAMRTRIATLRDPAASVELATVRGRPAEFGASSQAARPGAPLDLSLFTIRSGS